MIYKGSCLCGRVRFELDEPITRVGHCHCSMCRKWSGSAFLTYAGVEQGHLRWTGGEAELARYASSADYERCFCRHCGSSIVFIPRYDSKAKSWVAMGTLDSAGDLVPTEHIFLDSKAPWFEITDELRQFAGLPE